MNMIAHVSEDRIRCESVFEHLEAVANMAAEFAVPFGGQDWARAIGAVHDMGKCSREFQDRILNGGPPCDHSTAGAYELYRLGAGLLAYCVAGHHSGLPDGGGKYDMADDGGTLVSRMKRAEAGMVPNYRAFFEGRELPKVSGFSFPDGAMPADAASQKFALAFLTRMLYSCLVDADYLCTERFMLDESRAVAIGVGLPELAERVERYVERFYPPETDINRERCAILDACAEASKGKPGVYSLTVPTGGGKTIASLRFALQHAVHGGGQRRIIYAIPYTSIIDQNAEVFRKVLGCEVLEHHASFDFDDLKEQGGAIRLASENWDVPVLLTTNVQLFESLYSNKPSRCRKLHNIVGSVIVLDEAQMLPAEKLKPCVRALAELVLRYGCTVLLCTATQPPLGSFFEECGCPITEITPDPMGLYGRLKRVTYRYDDVSDDVAIAEKIAGEHQALCVVNSRKRARELYSLVKERGNAEEVFHLSTLMTPMHRKRVIAEIRERLREGEGCRLVSTSLIEAGVDVDFPAVYREISGIDSIVQCAGRCNRSQLWSAESSLVHVFQTDEQYALPSEVRHRIGVTRSVMLQELDGESMRSGGGSVEFDFGELETIDSYFRGMYGQQSSLDKDCSFDKLSKWNVGAGIPLIPFKSVAEGFKMIEDGSLAVIVPDESIAEEVEALENGIANRVVMRRLGQHTVNLYRADIEQMLQANSILLASNETYILLDQNLYDPETGLDVSNAGGRGVYL